VVPAKGSQERVLTILARETDPVTGTVIGPARFAEITVYEVTKDGNVELARLRTDDEGVAVFRRVFPAAGANLSVVGVFNRERQYSDPPVFLFCGDATITLRFRGTWPVCCPNDTTLVFRFLDERENPSLITMRPAGVAEYTLARTLFVVDCPNPADELVVTVPDPVPQPFRIREIRVNDRLVTGPTLRVRNGEAFSVLFAVSTREIGSFDESITFLVQCPGQPVPSRVTVRLLADVVAFTCTCPQDTILTIEPGLDAVETGTSRTYPPRTIYTNPIECRVLTVDSIVSHDVFRSWDVLQPLPGTEVQAGSDLRITTRFRPFQAGPAVDTFSVHFHLADGTPCRQRIVLVGRGCRAMCPIIVRPVRQPFSPEEPLAMDFGEVAFSPDPACGGVRIGVRRNITLLLPDTACCASPAGVNIAVVDADPRRVNSRFFDVTPTSAVQLYRSSEVNITVEFTAPTVSQFEELFATGQRVKTGRAEDSVFSIRIRLTNSSCGNCTQEIEVRVAVARFMRVSNIITLYAYGQNTPKLPDPPVRKVCRINCCPEEPDTYDIGRLYNLLNPITKYFPYPPDRWDFFVEVADTTHGRMPPQEPMLFRTAGTPFVNLYLFRTNYLERNFADAQYVVSELQNALNADPALFLRPSLPWSFPPSGSPVFPRPGDVYIISTANTWVGSASGHTIPCDIALMYIRKIFLGNEPNSTNDQSGIEYELIYPVVLY
ncbi:MAG: hypothetical protein QHI48_12285, partial [Bacteroidota bacterium]|nr:hypothetical protein [Bacteroidota bacterium]